MIDDLRGIISNLGDEEGAKVSVNLAPEDYFKLGTTIVISGSIVVIIAEAIKALRKK